MSLKAIAVKFERNPYASMGKDDLKPFKEECMVTKFRKVLLALLLTLTWTSTSSAALLLEPFVGYSMMDTDQATTPTPIAGEASGLGFGARLGLQFMGLMGGFQYDSAMATELEAVQGATTSKDDIKRTHMGIFVGYNLPVMVRLWGTYFFKSELEGDQATTADAGVDYIDSTETLNGAGYGLGVGFTGLPFLSVNLEYRTFEYDEEDDSDATPVTSAINPVVETSEIMLSVSFPFTI